MGGTAGRRPRCLDRRGGRRHVRPRRDDCGSDPAGDELWGSHRAVLAVRAGGRLRDRPHGGRCPPRSARRSGDAPGSAEIRRQAARALRRPRRLVLDRARRHRHGPRCACSPPGGGCRERSPEADPAGRNSRRSGRRAASRAPLRSRGRGRRPGRSGAGRWAAAPGLRGGRADAEPVRRTRRRSRLHSRADDAGGKRRGANSGARG